MLNKVRMSTADFLYHLANTMWPSSPDDFRVESHYRGDDGEYEIGIVTLRNGEYFEYSIRVSEIAQWNFEVTVNLSDHDAFRTNNVWVVPYNLHDEGMMRRLLMEAVERHRQEYGACVVTA